RKTPNTKQQQQRAGAVVWCWRVGVYLVFGVWILMFFNFVDLGFFERDGPPDEHPRDQPDKGEKHYAQNEPGEREPEDAFGHELREKIIEQRQAEQRDQESRP